MKITVIGTGYVGLVSGACLAEMGNDVLCLDLDAQDPHPQRAAASRSTTGPGGDGEAQRRRRPPALHHRRRSRGGPRRRCSSSPWARRPTKTARPTCSTCSPPPRNIGRHMTDYKVVVDKSTVPVGTADKVRAASPRNWPSAARPAFSVVSNPEFLKEGAAVEDFMKPDRIVVGADDERAILLMRALYAPFQRNRDRLIVMDVRSAELTKYAANAMLATRISFMNELANLAEKLGADIEHGAPRASAPTRASAPLPLPRLRLRRLLLPQGREGADPHRAGSGMPLACCRRWKRQRAPEGVLVHKIVAKRFGEDLSGRPSRSGAWPSSPTPTTCARRPAWCDGRAAGARCHRPGLRPGGHATRPAHLRRQPGSATPRRRWRRWKAPTRWPSSPSGRNSAAPISSHQGHAEEPVIFDGRNHDPVPLMDFIAAIERHTGKTANKVLMDIQPGDVPATYADVAALEAWTGFKPATSIDDGVGRFVAWYRSYFPDLFARQSGRVAGCLPDGEGVHEDGQHERRCPETGTEAGEIPEVFDVGRAKYGRRVHQVVVAWPVLRETLHT
jgi:UDPglucose 6-dehydrogenase